jgi:hypothetical protein
VKLLLDEMLPRSAAEELRARGHDVVMVIERTDLRSKSDEAIFAAAQAEQRAIVTEDIRGYRPLALAALGKGEAHADVVFTSNRAFPRSNPRTLGRLVSSLHVLLASEVELSGREYWLS